MRSLPLALCLFGTFWPMAVRAGDKPRAGATPGKHWAYQPPVYRPAPSVRDEAWARSPMDRFILARLEDAGLPPAPQADKRTLIRRATFDLTGLPPKPEEVDAFVNDDSPIAFAKVVDRLLASPAYGERWGRHWLDVARYADSNGLDENIAHGNAWRYRDYVVAAFNRDKPYDQFLLEQLAGDLLPASDTVTKHERLIATGFLALGPKVLAEVDETKMEMDIVDEQIDTFGRTVLALTLGCARCHDHKFDPIPTDDYYGLAGVFKSTRTMEHFKKIARWWENPILDDRDLARKAAHDRQIAVQKAAMQKVIDRANNAVRTKAPSWAQPKQYSEAIYAEKTKAELKRLREQVAVLEKSAPEMPSAMGVTEGKAVDVPVHVRGSHLTLGQVVARHVPRVVSGPNAPRLDGKQSGRLELAQWLVCRDHPLTARVMVNRIWRWHFGTGLVRTPDNFGRLGEPPTHPELLDWLALRFVDSGWSIKAMHRLIMLSAAYQQASGSADLKTNPQLVDPDNRLYWRANVRRLAAEEIRDSLLAVSGMLDRTMGGSLLHVKNREFFFDHTSKDTTRYDSPRRSLYLPVVRNHLYDVFQLFDATDATVPSGDRVTTTVAPQALFMMNSDLVAKASERLAMLLLANTKLDDAGRVRKLYRAAYGREATEDEVAGALELLQACQRELPKSSNGAPAWACVVQVTLSANEFLFVR